MALYKTVYYANRTGKVTESPVTSMSPAIDRTLIAKSKVVLVLRDSEGEDHLDNAGKFFLHRIIK
jgi:hypothetical protein